MNRNYRKQMRLKSRHVRHGHHGACNCPETWQRLYTLFQRFIEDPWRVHLDPCTSSIHDDHATVTCSLPLNHSGDHGRGFLRWDDNGWYAESCFTRDGIRHGLPYREGEPW